MHCIVNPNAPLGGLGYNKSHDEPLISAFNAPCHSNEQGDATHRRFFKQLAAPSKRLGRSDSFRKILWREVGSGPRLPEAHSPAFCAHTLCRKDQSLQEEGPVLHTLQDTRPDARGRRASKMRANSKLGRGKLKAEELKCKFCAWR